MLIEETNANRKKSRELPDLVKNTSQFHSTWLKIQ